MTAQDAPEIPDRLFFRIGDVSEITGVESYVLRFWESEFPSLRPKKSSNGQRQYRRKDVQTVLEIKRLLYDEGFTIAGARKALRSQTRQKKREPQPVKPARSLFGDLEPVANSKEIKEIKKELKAILAILRRR